MALYKKKAASAAAQVDELFDRYDTDSSGALDGKQLREAMAGIGLPPTDERVRSVLVQDDANGDGQLQRSEFAKLLLETWGGPVDVDFSTALPTIYPSLEAGQRAFIWVGRSVPTHYVLRALQDVDYPYPGHGVEVLMNCSGSGSSINNEQTKVSVEQLYEYFEFRQAVQTGSPAQGRTQRLLALPKSPNRDRSSDSRGMVQLAEPSTATQHCVE